MQLVNYTVQHFQAARTRILIASWARSASTSVLSEWHTTGPSAVQAYLPSENVQEQVKGIRPANSTWLTNLETWDS